MPRVCSMVPSKVRVFCRDLAQAPAMAPSPSRSWCAPSGADRRSAFRRITRNTTCQQPKVSHYARGIYLIFRFTNNQLEKLEAAKAALLVCLSLLSLTGSFLVLLGQFSLTLPGLT